MMKYTFRLFATFLALVLACSIFCGKAWAAAGQLYSGGLNTHAVYRFNSAGVQSTFLAGPYADSIAFDSKGNLFVANPQTLVLLKISPDGTPSNFDSGYAPAGLAFDANGHLFAVDSGNGNIYKYSPNGSRVTFATGLNGPFGLAFDQSGRLYVSEVNTNSILRFSPNGTQDASAFATGLHGPLGIAFDRNGNLFEVDFLTGAVNKISSTGVVTLFATSLNSPRHLAFDRSGNLFASNSGTQQIFEYPPTFTVGGTPIVFASTTTAAGLAFEPPTAILANISTRLSVQTDPARLIGGFIITGTDNKRVLIRGLGPSLSVPAGTQLLANPILELHKPDNSVVTNDNWKTGGQQAEIQAILPPPNDLESALIATLAPGAYTAILGGVNSGTGVGQVEVYDLDRTAFSELANISTRGLVQTGNNVMIGGFITIDNNGMTQVLIRALGPSLPVGPQLQDPVLELHDANGALRASNDDWISGGQQAEIQAILPPPNNLESALIATVPAGNYSAVVFGKNGGTGIGQVEIYRLK